ncbi:MAG TPA: cytochrome P450, partial [Acidimicrobiia bacterium]|nr:cytochrome P450 [Acidimicrobiia bacterium]
MADTQTIEHPASDLYYDPYDYEVDVNAQAVWKRLRDEAPLYWNEKFEFFALSRYDDILAAMLDTDTFSSAHATTIELMTPEPAQVPMMIWMDPPNHTRFRALVNRAFTPRAISDLEGRIARLCGQLLDPHVGAGSFDYVDQFAALLPPTVILALLGFPEGHESQWRTGVDALFHVEEGGTGFAVGDDGLPAGLSDPNSEMNAALLHLLPDIMAERRANPADDLMSMLVNSEFEDPDGNLRKINDVEFHSFIQMLAIAGTETVARLLSWAAVILARNP